MVTKVTDTQHGDTQHDDTQHDETQHNSIQHNDTQHKGLICDPQYKPWIECYNGQCS